MAVACCILWKLLLLPMGGRQDFMQVLQAQVFFRHRSIYEAAEEKEGFLCEQSGDAGASLQLSQVAESHRHWLVTRVCIGIHSFAELPGA